MEFPEASNFIIEVNYILCWKKPRKSANILQNFRYKYIGSDNIQYTNMYLCTGNIWKVTQYLYGYHIYVPIEAYYPIEAHPPFREQKLHANVYIRNKMERIPTKTTYKRFF